MRASFLTLCESRPRLFRGTNVVLSLVLVLSLDWYWYWVGNGIRSVLGWVAIQLWGGRGRACACLCACASGQGGRTGVRAGCVQVCRVVCAGPCKSLCVPALWMCVCTCVSVIKALSFLMPWCSVGAMPDPCSATCVCIAMLMPHTHRGRAQIMPHTACGGAL